MARIISAPLGEIRGKLGGMVFSRNQFGMIVRQHVQGVDPATPAQLNARQQLAQSAMLFRTLTPLQRAQWAQWAETSWIPLGKKAGNGAVQAFTAAYSQAMRYAQVESSTVTTPQGAGTVTRTSSIPSLEPPCRMPQAMVTSAGQPNSLHLDSVTLTPGANSCTIDVQISADNAWEGGQLLAYTDPTLLDETPMGIVIWQGAPVPHTGSPTGNQLFERVLATSGIITSAINTTAGVTPIHIQVETSYIPTPTRDTDKPFLMPVEDVFMVRPLTVGVYNEQGLATPLGTIITQHC